MFEPGTIFGNYYVLANSDGKADMIGSGPAGTIMRARHQQSKSLAAIKVLRRLANQASPNGQEFLADARSVSKLSHPNIGRILEFGEISGGFYYVTELCEGGSLESYRGLHGPPEEAVILSWLHQATAALAHAHGHHLLHRDIKPTNLLISRDDDLACIKLVDFGLAGKVDAQNQVNFTPLFCAPEQLRDQAVPASDVFALGATMLWLLNGRHLDAGVLNGVIRQRLTASSYAHALADLSPAWKNLLGAFLTVDPGGRPADGAAALLLLENIFASRLPLLPVPWSVFERHPSQSVQAPPVLASPAPAADVWEHVDTPDWGDVWTPIDEIVSDHLSLGFTRRYRKESGHWDVQIFENPGRQLADLLTVQASTLARHAAALGLGRIRLVTSPNWKSVAWPKPSGASALSLFREQGACPPALLFPRMVMLAQGLDACAADGLIATEIHPGILQLTEPTAAAIAGGYALTFQLPLATSPPPENHPATPMDGADKTGLSLRFAACLYHLLSGSPLPAEALLDPNAYPPTPHLSANSNAWLAQIFSGTPGDLTCSDLLQRLVTEERVPDASPAAIPPSISPVGASPSAANPSRPPHLTQPTTSIPERPPAVAPAAAPPAAPPAATRARRLPVTWMVAAAVTLVAASIAIWMAIARKSPAPPPVTQGAPSTGDTRPDAPPKPSRPAPVVPTPKPSGPLIVTKNDMTLADAIARCATGGVIEIHGGTYQETLAITKTLTIEASDGAVLEPSSESSPLVVKGNGNATIKGLKISDPSKETSGALNTKSPLILVTNSASLTLDQCEIEGSQGSGITVMGQANVTLTACRILRCADCGMTLNSGGNAKITHTTLLENRIGISLTGATTAAQLLSGSIITRSSINGVELHEGAEFSLDSSEISSSQQGSGLIATDTNTKFTAKNSKIMGNKAAHGIQLKNQASAEIDHCKVEHNEDGIFAEEAGKLSVTNSSFENVICGISIYGGENLSVKSSTFTGHSTCGLNAVNIRLDVEANTFHDKPIAIILGDYTSGKLSNNKISKSLGEAIVIEEKSTVTKDGNTQIP